MDKRTDPWYVHAGLWVVIGVLIVILIQVAIIEPKEIVALEKYYKSEARARMKNLKEAEILYFNKFGQFTNNLDTLINFVKTHPYVDSVINGYDSLSNRPTNPFIKLANGEFTPDSLFTTPRSGERFLLEIDTLVSVDSVVTPSGKLLRVETKTKIGTKYRIEDPDGYGSIGDLSNEALKNTASWE